VLNKKANYEYLCVNNHQVYSLSTIQGGYLQGLSLTNSRLVCVSLIVETGRVFSICDVVLAVNISLFSSIKIFICQTVHDTSVFLTQS